MNSPHAYEREIFRTLEPLAHTAELIPYLDRLEETNLPYWGAVRNTVTALPSGDLYLDYGEEALVWAAANSPRKDTEDRHTRALGRWTSFDIPLIQRTCSWYKAQVGVAHGQNVLAQYRTSEAILDHPLESDTLAQLIHENARPGIAPSAAREASYALVGVTTQLNNSTGTYRHTGTANGNWTDPGWNNPDAPGTPAHFHIHMDAPVGVVLLYKDKPQAIASVAMHSPHELMIYQLQGVLGNRVVRDNASPDQTREVKVSSRGLATLAWKDFLVHAVETFARSQGIANVGIQSADNNMWTQVYYDDTGEPHLTPADAVKNYDTTAQNLGYTLGDDDNWHRPL